MHAIAHDNTYGGGGVGGLECEQRVDCEQQAVEGGVWISRKRWSQCEQAVEVECDHYKINGPHVL